MLSRVAEKNRRGQPAEETFALPTTESVQIDSDRTVVLSNLPKETKWRDVSWLVTYCGNVVMRRKFTCPKNAGDCIFVVMFESDQAAEDILLLADTEVRERPLQVATVKVFRQRLTMQEVQVNVSGKIQRIGTVIQSQSQSGRAMGEAGSVCVSSRAPSECESAHPTDVPDAAALERRKRRAEKRKHEQDALDNVLQAKLKVFCDKKTEDQLKLCAKACFVVAAGTFLSTRAKAKKKKEVDSGLGIIEGQVRKLV